MQSTHVLPPHSNSLIVQAGLRAEETRWMRWMRQDRLKIQMSERLIFGDDAQNIIFFGDLNVENSLGASQKREEIGLPHPNL